MKNADETKKEKWKVVGREDCEEGSKKRTNRKQTERVENML